VQFLDFPDVLPTLDDVVVEFIEECKGREFGAWEGGDGGEEETRDYGGDDIEGGCYYEPYEKRRC